MLEMVSVEHGRVIPSPLSNFLFNQGFLCSLPSMRMADSSEWTCTILRRLPHITFGSQRLGWSLWRCRFVWRPRPFWASWILVYCLCIADCTFHIAIPGIALFIHFIAQISKGLDIFPSKVTVISLPSWSSGSCSSSHWSETQPRSTKVWYFIPVSADGCWTGGLALPQNLDPPEKDHKVHWITCDGFLHSFHDQRKKEGWQHASLPNASFLKTDSQQLRISLPNDWQ